jgi:protein TonB
MKTELILKSDVLDIVFDNRNKDYGAYDLRKFYDNRLMRSVGMMLLVVIVLSAFTFIPKKKITVDNGMYETVTTHLKEPEKKVEKKEPKEAPKKAAEKPVSTKKDVAQILIVKDDKRADTVPTLNENDKIGSTTIKVAGGDGPPIIQPQPGDGGGKGPFGEPSKPVINVNTPVDNPEIMPSYPGGMNALRKFLERNLTNPKEMEEGEEVSVKVKFVVGYDGKLQSFITMQDGGEEFNKEVIRVLKKMPNWEPGKSNGQNVAVYYTIPVKFVSAN